ncbi:MAG: hypothetical protein Q9221_000233 [Calogaya cf. arnoldii]
MSAGTDFSSTKENAASLTEFQEPPVRPPAPSFEDYKGLERQGVLEYMQPLGQAPSQRVKLRTKPFDTSKRPTHAKNGEPTAAASEEMSTPDPVPPPPSRCSESRKTEDRTSRLSASRVKEEDSEYTPTGVPLVTPSKAGSSYSSHQETPSSLVTARTAKLADVVKNAVKQADGKGDPVLGQALNRLYKRSFHDPLLLDVIEAVLSRKPSEIQNKDFKKYLRGTSKEIRKESGMPEPFSPTPARGTSSDLKISPLLNNSRNNVLSTNSTNVDKRHHGGSTPTSHPHSPTKSARHNAKSLANNTSSSKKQAVPDRSRRNSTSSLSSVASSLSSVDANVALQGEEEFGGSKTPPPPPTASAEGGKVNVSAGPKMGTFIVSNAHKRTFASTGASQEDEGLAAKRRKLQQTFPDYKVKDSDVRTAMPQSGDKTVRTRVSTPKVQHPAAEVPRLRNGMERRGMGEEPEELDSPTTSMHSDLLIPPPAFAGSSRRGTTPLSLGRPAKSTKKSARVKMSPLKKKNGVVAGMPRLSGGTNSPIGSSHADGDGLNSDDCSACGGPGRLLCCDGCTRAFHFTCIDPPKDAPPEGEWYCRACAAQPSRPPARGVFPILLRGFEKRNPRAYNLPRWIRDYFTDIVTGDDGEYEEPGAPASKAKTRTGYDMPLDTLKLKDAKDNIIFCFKCRESAMGRREMINCDYCNLYWHLDCLDPPLASAPKKSGKGTWKCPNHVDSIVAVPRSASGKVYKVRRPKNPQVVRPALPRGHRNNGMIEIEYDSSEEEEDQPPCTIYRIPAVAIKMDFINKMKKSNQAAARARDLAVQAEERRRQQQQQLATNGKDSPNQEILFRGRTSAEREAAVSLAHFAQSDANSQLSGDRVEELVLTLYAEAPLDINGTTNGNHTYSMTNGDNPVGSVNGGLPDMHKAPSHANAHSSNKAAYAANHVRSVGTPLPAEPQSLIAEEEEILRLEAILQRRKALIQKQIATMRSIPAST